VFGITYSPRPGGDALGRTCAVLHLILSTFYAVHGPTYPRALFAARLAILAGSLLAVHLRSGHALAHPTQVPSADFLACALLLAAPSLASLPLFVLEYLRVRRIDPPTLQ
jgi:hypothetical protein